MNEPDLKAAMHKTLEILFGSDKTGDEVYQLWEKFDPKLAKQISTFFAGQLYSRNVISQKQRELCAIAALTVLQRLDALRIHIGAALNAGATQSEVAEVIFQTMTYGGVPTMIQGLKICQEVLSERGLWDP